MLERTKKELLEIWSDITILRDPAPSPIDGETIKNLKKVGKAFFEDLNDIIKDKTNNHYEPIKKIQL